MGSKHEMVRRCEGIRELIDARKYTTALEEIDTMELADIPSVSDLYLFAELYEKAERMEKKKEIYYAIYERTHSRRILYQLLRLLIRMGDIEEAKEKFLAYEIVGGVTLDTYELRYRLARAEGEPRTRLIEILEELKKEEYTEEWGYQLALLYEMEGEREKCIHECEDLKLWFGTGPIVDKAMQLKTRCEDKDWEPPHEEEIPEPVEPEHEDILAYAVAPASVTELETDQKSEDDSKSESRAVYEDSAFGGMSEGVSEVKKSAPKPEPVSEPVSASESVPVPEPEPVSELSSAAMEAVSEPAAIPKPETSVEEEMPVKKETPGLHIKTQPVENPDALPEEDAEDISDRGVQYHTIKHTIRHIKHDKKQAHFVFAGGDERITLTVAKRIAKELNHVGYFSAQQIVKITAEKLNGLQLAEQLEKVQGGCMLVTSAPDLTKEAVGQIEDLIRVNGDHVVVMLAGPFDEMDCFLSIYPELAAMLTYKIRM
jgi:hypothetical protein